MKQSFIYALFGLLLLTFVPSLAHAEAVASDPAIAVIDMQVILNQSKAAKNIQSQMETQQKKYQGQISGREDALRSAEQELVKQQQALSPEAFEKKRKDFERQVVEAQKLVQERRRSLDVAYGQAMKVLREEAAKIIADLAAKEGITLVLPRSSVVMAEKSLDITAPVLEKLDKTLATVPVKWADKS